jgi:polyisoprenoid-binding protein YceI
MLRTLIATALLALSAPMGAQAWAHDWDVDQEASSVGFVTQVMGETTGSFSQFSAQIHFDPDHLGHATITAQVEVATGSTGNGQLDDSMLSADGLAPSDHPLATFISTDIRTTETGYEAHGTLNIRGVEQPVTLPFTLQIDGTRAIADGRFDILRDDYGVGASGWGDTAANVSIVVHIEADRVE